MSLETHHLQKHPIPKLKGAAASIWGRMHSTYKIFPKVEVGGGRPPNLRRGEYPVLKLKGAAASLWDRMPSKPISSRSP